MTVRRGYVAVSFGQIHYRYAGTPGKPVVLLLHQTPSTSEMYVDLMEELADDFRLLAPDTPGMGLSDPVAGEMSIAALADGVAEFLDELGVESCFVFGHHTGASIAAELGRRHPGTATAVAMSGPTLLSDELRDKLPGMATTIPVDSDGSHMQAMWDRLAAKDPNASADIVTREALSGIQIGECYGAAYQAVVEQDFAGAAESLECPALVFAGTGDPLHGQLDATLALLKRGRSASIEGARTFLCETHCKEVAELLRDFFAAEAS